MGKDIHYYENIIKEKRKKTPFREFVKELGSWEVLNLYKNHEQVCRYPPNTGRVKKLGTVSHFWETAKEYGRLYDFSQGFFENLQDLHDHIPFSYVGHLGIIENCDFSDSIFYGKNCYLTFNAGLGIENILYATFIYPNVHNVLNCFLVTNNASNIYMSGGIMASHNIFYSKFITDSSNIWFSSNLIGCEECIGCDNLQNQKFYIGNKPFTKEEYQKKKEKILSDKTGFKKYYLHVCEKKGINFGSEEVEGNFIIKSSKIQNGGWLNNFHNGRNVLIGNGGDASQNAYDCIDTGVNFDEYYACVAGGGPNSTNMYCSTQIAQCSFSYYSYFLESCHHCLGCIGLKNKSYCILNKQYSKEEWEEKACSIFASMEADGTLGSFFPASMNPFYFNDTMAYLIDPSFTKEEVEKEGYMWRDDAIKVDIPEGMKVIHNTDLHRYQGFDEQGNWYIDPEILNVVILDEQGNYYRIVPMEYDFLMKHALPLPEMHWLERIRMGFGMG